MMVNVLNIITYVGNNYIQKHCYESVVVVIGEGAPPG